MEEQIYDFMDRILKMLSKGSGVVSGVPGFRFDSREGRNSVNLLKKYELVRFRNDNISSTTIADITPLGQQVANMGIRKYLSDIQSRETEKSALEFKKIKIDVRNSERIFKTYWWTFGLAVLGFLLAIYSAFFKK